MPVQLFSRGLAQACIALEEPSCSLPRRDCCAASRRRAWGKKRGWAVASTTIRVVGPICSKTLHAGDCSARGQAIWVWAVHASSPRRQPRDEQHRLQHPRPAGPGNLELRRVAPGCTCTIHTVRAMHTAVASESTSALPPSRCPAQHRTCRAAGLFLQNLTLSTSKRRVPFSLPLQRRHQRPR